MLVRHETFAEFLRDENSPLREAFFAEAKKDAQEVSLTRYVNGSMTSAMDMQAVVTNLSYFSELQQEYLEICATAVCGKDMDITALSLDEATKCKSADFLDRVLFFACCEYLVKTKDEAGALKPKLKEIFDKQGLLKNADQDAKNSEAHSGCNDAKNFVRDKMVHGLAALIIGAIKMTAHNQAGNADQFHNQNVLSLISRQLKIDQEKLTAALDKFVDAAKKGECDKLLERTDGRTQAYLRQQTRMRSLRGLFGGNDKVYEQIVADPLFTSSGSMGEYFNKYFTQLYTQICEEIFKKAKRANTELSVAIAEQRKFITTQLSMLSGQDCKKFDGGKVISAFKKMIKEARIPEEDMAVLNAMLKKFKGFFEKVFGVVAPCLKWDSKPPVLSRVPSAPVTPRLSASPKPLGFGQSPTNKAAATTPVVKLPAQQVTPTSP